MSPNTNEILITIEGLSKHLIQGLNKLTDDQWESPSRCHMWAVKDVVSHLVAINGFFLNSMTRALEGDSLPAHGMPNPGTGNAVQMSDGIASRAIQMSETTLSRRIDSMDALTYLENSLITMWKKLDESQWDIPAYHPVNQLSPNLILELKLMEIIVHSWDIFNGVDAKYKISNRGGILLCDVWKNSLLNRWLFTPGNTQNDLVQLDFEIGSGKSLRLINYNASLTMTDEHKKDDTADATIQIAPETLALAITARKNLVDLVESHEAHIEGNKDKALLFHNWFKGS